MSYIQKLNGTYPTAIKELTGEVGTNSNDANFRLNYKTIDELNKEREETISKLYEQYTSGKIKMSELEEMEDKINKTYEDLMNKLPQEQSRER